MAHGFAGTKDSGLQPFAEALAGGRPRRAGLRLPRLRRHRKAHRARRFRCQRQIEDYRAAMAAAARLPGVDPNRIVLWGSSLSGGHVLRGRRRTRRRRRGGRHDAAGRTALAAGRHALVTQHGASDGAPVDGAGVRSRIAGARGKPAVMMPVVSRPG